MVDIAKVLEETEEERDEQAKDLLTFISLTLGCAMIGFELRSFPIGGGIFLILCAFMAKISNNHDRLIKVMKK
jgi:hypothetical protein